METLHKMSFLKEVTGPNKVNFKNIEEQIGKDSCSCTNLMDEPTYAHAMHLRKQWAASHVWTPPPPPHSHAMQGGVKKYT